MIWRHSEPFRHLTRYRVYPDRVQALLDAARDPETGRVEVRRLTGRESDGCPGGKPPRVPDYLQGNYIKGYRKKKEKNKEIQSALRSGAQGELTSDASWSGPSGKSAPVQRPERTRAKNSWARRVRANAHRNRVESEEDA